VDCVFTVSFSFYTTCTLYFSKSIHFLHLSYDFSCRWLHPYLQKYHLKYKNRLPCLSFSVLCFSSTLAQVFTTRGPEAWLPSHGSYGLEPVWLPLRSTACSTYLFSTKIHAKLLPNCQCKWSSSLLLIIIIYLLYVIVNTSSSSSVDFPNPGMSISLREDNIEKIGNAFVLSYPLQSFILSLAFTGVHPFFCRPFVPFL